jgi:hypothetical protein
VIEQSLLFTDDTMVTFSCFFNESNILIHLFLGGEGHTVDTLEAIIGSLTKPISRRILHYFESLDSAGHWDMGASAEINKVSISISGDFSSIRNLGLDKLDLERVIGEKTKSLFFAEDNTLESLLF